MLLKLGFAVYFSTEGSGRRRKHRVDSTGDYSPGESIGTVRDRHGKTLA